MIFILTFPETYGPMFCERFLRMCCPPALLPRTHSPPHTCSHQRAAMPSTPVCQQQEGGIWASHPLGPSGVQSLLLQQQGILGTPPWASTCSKGGRFQLAAPVSWVWAPWVLDRAQMSPWNCCSGQLCSLCRAGRCHLCSCCRLEIGRDFSENLPIPSFEIHLTGLSNWKNGNGRGSPVFYWSEQTEPQIPELLVAERAEPEADPAAGALLLRRALCKAGERSLQNVHRYSECPSVCTELLCPATADKGDCGRNLSSCLDPGACMSCAFCAPPGFGVNSFHTIAMK